MSDSSKYGLLEDPLPQVGAILYLNTELPQKEPHLGSRHWMLDGSCVLVAPDKVLTVIHTLKDAEVSDHPLPHNAVFLPFEGIFRVMNLEARREDEGDNLALLTLDRPVLYAAPLRVRRILERQKHTGYAFIAGYGEWLGPPLGQMDGLQRRFWVRQGIPKWNSTGRRLHYDNLDLVWWSAWNRDRASSINNSGGPMMWIDRDRRSFTVVGINRELKGNENIGSWIGIERYKWLQKSIKPFSDESLQTPVGWQSILVEVQAGVGSHVVLAVPDEATVVRVTASATPGTELQMGIGPSGRSARLLASLQSNNRSSGRFLCRTERLPASKGKTVVALAPIAVSGAAPRAFVQLSALFT